jgi:hypothetical protein
LDAACAIHNPASRDGSRFGHFDCFDAGGGVEMHCMKPELTVESSYGLFLLRSGRIRVRGKG